MPTCCNSAKFIIPILLPTATASVWLCVTYNMVEPNSWFISFISANIRYLFSISICEIGSSSKNIDGSLTNARANDTLCCCPPLKVVVFKSRISSIPIISLISLILFLIILGFIFFASKQSAIFSLTVK